MKQSYEVPCMEYHFYQISNIISASDGVDYVGADEFDV